MSNESIVMLAAAGAAAGVMLIAWLASLRMRDVSVVDVAWTLGVVLVAWLGFAFGDGAAARKLLVTALTTVWGLRLAGYLAVRKVRHPGEDFRYQTMRERYGPRFPMVSLPLVFAVQAVGVWVVSLPVQAAQVATSPRSLTALDVVGTAVWTIGFLFEAAADLHLARFRADPSNRGRVLETGLWRYTRHPNYFGEFCLWWGMFLIALSTGAWWSIAGPLTISVILIRFFGVQAMDEHLAGHRSGHAAYVRRTSAFLPLPPRR